MRRFLVLFFSFCAALAFSAAVPGAAVAGLHTVAVSSSAAGGDQCDAGTSTTPDFLVLTCHRKTSHDFAVPPCPPLHATAGAGDAAAFENLPRGHRPPADHVLVAADPERLLRPPRG